MKIIIHFEHLVLSTLQKLLRVWLFISKNKLNLCITKPAYVRLLTSKKRYTGFPKLYTHDEFLKNNKCWRKEFQGLREAKINSHRMNQYLMKILTLIGSNNWFLLMIFSFWMISLYEYLDYFQMYFFFKTFIVSHSSFLKYN